MQVMTYDLSTISEFDKVEIVGEKAASSVNKPMTKSVTFGDANDSYRPKAYTGRWSSASR